MPQGAGGALAGWACLGGWACGAAVSAWRWGWSVCGGVGSAAGASGCVGATARSLPARRAPNTLTTNADPQTFLLPFHSPPPPAPPQVRAQRHDARAVPRPRLHAGRRPHLLPAQPDRDRDQGRARPDRGHPDHVWVHQVRDQPVHAAGEERRRRRDLGDGGGRAAGGAGAQGLGLRGGPGVGGGSRGWRRGFGGGGAGRRGAGGREAGVELATPTPAHNRAGARSTGPSTSSRSRTRWAASGSAPPSS